MLENVLKWSTDSNTNLTVVCRHRWSRSSADEDHSAGWKLLIFTYVHLRLSAPAMSTDNSQVGVAICTPF